MGCLRIEKKKWLSYDTPCQWDGGIDGFCAAMVPACFDAFSSGRAYQLKLPVLKSRQRRLQAIVEDIWRENTSLSTGNPDFGMIFMADEKDGVLDKYLFGKVGSFIAVRGNKALKCTPQLSKYYVNYHHGDKHYVRHMVIYIELVKKPKGAKPIEQPKENEHEDSGW